MYRKYVKTIFDVTLSLILLTIFLPLIMCIALITRFQLGAPILFKQLRPGKFGKPFVIWKFRTLKNTCDQFGELLPDELRMTFWGSFLRRFSIDELPELWNIIKGDMSLVGPRPLLIEYLPLYSDEQKRRHEVKPGITGWAQVNGRNAINWQEKFKLDVWYVDNCSFILDVKILFLTLYKVIRRESISAAGHVTSPKFEGNNNMENNV